MQEQLTSLVTRDPLNFSCTITWLILCFIMFSKFINGSLPDSEFTIINLLPVQCWIMFSIAFYWIKNEYSSHKLIISLSAVVIFMGIRMLVSYKLIQPKPGSSKQES